MIHQDSEFNIILGGVGSLEHQSKLLETTVDDVDKFCATAGGKKGTTTMKKRGSATPEWLVSAKTFGFEHDDSGRSLYEDCLVSAWADRLKNLTREIEKDAKDYADRERRWGIPPRGGDGSVPQKKSQGGAQKRPRASSAGEAQEDAKTSLAALKAKKESYAALVKRAESTQSKLDKAGMQMDGLRTEIFYQGVSATRELIHVYGGWEKAVQDSIAAEKKGTKKAKTEAASKMKKKTPSSDSELPEIDQQCSVDKLRLGRQITECRRCLDALDDLPHGMTWNNFLIENTLRAALQGKKTKSILELVINVSPLNCFFC